MDAIKAPTVVSLEREIGTEAILTLLLFEIEKVNRMLNVNDKLKLTHEQCADISMLLLEEFPHESLEDFVLAFKRGITGRYDEKLLRLDVQVICRWIRSFLEEKAEKQEVLRTEFKHEEIKPYTAEERANINKIIAESWVGQVETEKQKEADYKEFKKQLFEKRKQQNEENRTAEPERIQPATPLE